MVDNKGNKGRPLMFIVRDSDCLNGGGGGGGGGGGAARAHERMWAGQVAQCVERHLRARAYARTVSCEPIRAGAGVVR